MALGVKVTASILRKSMQKLRIVKSKHTTFETLPAEIRVLIYHYLFKDLVVPLDISKDEPDGLALFRVNKTIGTESREVFFTEAAFAYELVRVGDTLSPVLMQSAPLFRQAVFIYPNIPISSRRDIRGKKRPSIELCTGLPWEMLNSPLCSLSIVTVFLGVNCTTWHKGFVEDDVNPTFTDLISQFSRYGDAMRARGGILRVILVPIFSDHHQWEDVKPCIQAIEEAAAMDSVSWTLVPRKEFLQKWNTMGINQCLLVDKNG